MSSRIGVLISGRGSNLQALIDAVRDRRVDTSIALVVSNNPAAPGLERATSAGIRTMVMPHRSFPTREAYDRAIAETLLRQGVGLVCLAGFMRVLGRGFLEAFPSGVLNVHPSLLPSFPGVEAQRRALEHGVRISGATVHLVTVELDAGPIVLQAAVPVMPTDTVESLSARILVEEHRIYPEAVRLVLAGGWRIEGRRFIV